MLVLSRQRDETIMIGDDVEITIVDIRGDKVRIGINAPRHIQVHRKEVYDAIKRENQQAAQLNPRDVSDAVLREASKTKPEKQTRDGVGRETGKKPRDTEDAKPGALPAESKKLVDPQRPDQMGRPQ